LIFEAHPAFSTSAVSFTCSIACSGRSPAQGQMSFSLNVSHGHACRGLHMQWPSFTDRCIIRLRFSMSITGARRSPSKLNRKIVRNHPVIWEVTCV